jgi:hypothetical protein
LVDDHVDDLGGFVEMRGECRHIGVQAAKQKPAIGFEPGYFCQIVRALFVEAVWDIRRRPGPSPSKACRNC